MGLRISSYLQLSDLEGGLRVFRIVELFSLFGLKAIPDEVWAVGSARVIDLSNNAIEEVSIPVNSVYVQV